MASNVKNDEEAQLFYSQEMLQKTDSQTMLVGVVDSENFAESDGDYFVGKGVLAGIIGVHSTPPEEIRTSADARWRSLREKASQQEPRGEDSQPVFCWVDSVRHLIEAEAENTDWLEVDDMVGPLSLGSEDKVPLFPSIPQAGLVILLKICGALADRGYPPKIVRRVGTLVKRNMMTAVRFEGLPPQTQSAPGKEELMEMTIKLTLASMLDSKVKQSRTVNMNSNEPVLLINNFGALRHELVRDIVSLTMKQLQQDWNVWPVRVYAGPFMVGQVSDKHRGQGFSITLLNVVNTDIGGPSMIDLLDQASDAPIWSYSFSSFFKEVWRHRELIEKLETDAPVSRSSSSSSVSRRSEASVTSEISLPRQSPAEPPMTEEDPVDESSMDVQPLQDEDANLAPVEMVEAEAAGTSIRSGAAADASGNDKFVWDDVRARFDTQDLGRGVKHPTFQHVTRRESLLDLIRSQAELAEKPSDIKEMEATLEGRTKQPSSSSEDEFVVFEELKPCV